MDEFLLNLKNKHLIPLTVIIGFSIWLIMCYCHYKNFWFDTIYRVQTVDFNLLHHTLPITLSELITANRGDLIQSVLDSSYGLFGLVVTDGCGDTILYKTNAIYHRRSWQKHLSIEDLAKASQLEKFDYLTLQPPTNSFLEHISPRDTVPPVQIGLDNRTGENSPKIIGRVYYLREIPPSFINDLTTFLTTGIFDISQSKRGYLIISACDVILCICLLGLIWLRQQALNYKKQEIKSMKRELEIKKRAVENLANQLAVNKSRKMWLEREAKEVTNRACKLKASLTELKGYFADLNGEEKHISHKLNFSPQTKALNPVQLLSEAEEIVPELSKLAQNLTSQATTLQDQCLDLENKRLEMEKIIDQALLKTLSQPGYVGNTRI